MDESDARNALVMESESCSIDDEEEDSALWMRTMWLMAKGQRRRETFMEARMVRSGRKMIRQPVSLTFIQGFQGALKRRRIHISRQKTSALLPLNSGPPS